MRFDLDGDGDIGAVVVHGFTGTPYEVRYLGESLAREGIPAVGPCLTGHCTTLDELDQTRWQDWVDDVEREVEAMARRVPRVALIGQSLGGLLALYVAGRRRDVSVVCSLAAPLWLEGLNRFAARWALPIGIRRLPKLGGSDVRDQRARRENPCYPAVPTHALHELLDFMRVVDEALPRVAQPVLVLHASQDHTAPVACARRIASRTRAKRMRILPESYHLIAVDVERDVVAAEVISFVRNEGIR